MSCNWHMKNSTHLVYTIWWVGRYVNICDTFITIKVKDISSTTQSFLVSFCFCYCFCFCYLYCLFVVRKLNMNATLLTNFEMHNTYCVVNYRHHIVQQISRIYSFCIMKTLYSLDYKSPHPPSPRPWESLLYSLL